MQVVIMCAGRSKRFGTHKPKPLALVEGVPNVVRISNQIKSICGEESHVTVNKERKGYFNFLNLPLIVGGF